MQTDPPVLMALHDADMQAINQAPHPETGMNVQVVLIADGPIAVLADGSALPCYATQNYYDLFDLIAGVPAPQRGQPNFTLPAPYRVVSSRLQAQAAIAAAGVASATTPAVGAHPLIARRTLTAPTVFLRYISSAKDRRFIGTNLLPQTYLTTPLEAGTATSGFAAVGRFSLPLPVPACTVIEYELPAGSVIDAGTVAPLFGQSGGGVEICLASSPSVTRIRSRTVPEY